MRLVPLLALFLLSACRPEVEGQVPCARNGDLSCPTGWHCGSAGLCIEEEGKPVFEVAGLEFSQLTGVHYFTVKATSASPFESLEVLARGRGANVPLSPELVESTPTRSVWTTEFRTWMLRDGEASLELIANLKDGRQFVHELFVSISNGLPELSLWPAAGSLSAAPQQLQGEFVSENVPIDSIVVVQSVNGASENHTPTIRWADGSMKRGSFTFDFDASADAGKKYEFRVTITNAGTHSVSQTVAYFID